MEFFTIEDFDLENKTVLVRVDINSHVENGKKIKKTPRIKAHAKTLKVLSEKKAKVVTLAHQGRPGSKDFTHLDEHAKLLEEEIGKEVKFVRDIIGEEAITAIKNLRPGDILLLDNVRMLEDEMIKKSIEEHANSSIVRNLYPLADYFILDGFSVAHRSHASVVGFATKLPCIAGPVLEKEVNSITRSVFSLPQGFDILGPSIILPDLPRLSLKWTVFILGGAKVDDCIDVMIRFSEERFKKTEKFLLGGLTANLFLIAAGFDIGDENKRILEKKGYLKLLPLAKKLLRKRYPQIILPIDVAYEKNGKRIETSAFPVDGIIKDIGTHTIKMYEKIIEDAKSIIFKGPLGVYEDARFSYGTRKILEAVANSKAYSVLGGGDTSTAVESLGLKKAKFSYISLAGGAFIQFLSGKKLPGLEALKLSYKLFKKTA